MCFEPSYRAAIAALAPWLAELDGEPLRRGRDELAEGSGAVSDSRNADLLERAARQAAEAAAAAVLAHSAAEAARAMGENDGDGDGDELELSDDSTHKKRSPKKGPVDEALTRYKAKKAGKSHAKPRDTREVTFALTDETLQALDDDGVSTKAAEGSVVSTEPEEHKAPTETNLSDDEDEDAKAERKKAKKRDRKERERRRAEADEADAAVVDHELRYDASSVTCSARRRRSETRIGFAKVSRRRRPSASAAAPSPPTRSRRLSRSSSRRRWRR